MTDHDQAQLDESVAMACETVLQGSRKHAWAPITLGDAFKGRIDFEVRMEARHRLRKACRGMQARVSVLAPRAGERRFTPLARSQWSSAFLDYPSKNFAAVACVGASALAEFRLRPHGLTLTDKLKGFLSDPKAHLRCDAQRDYLKAIAGDCAQAVEDWLLLQALSRPKFEAVESFRILSAWSSSGHFETVTDLLRHCVLFGDLTPGLDAEGADPLERECRETRQMLRALDAVCNENRKQLEGKSGPTIVRLACDWVIELTVTLAQFLPPTAEVNPRARPLPGSDESDQPAGMPEPETDDDTPFRYGEPDPDPPENDRFEPFDKKKPPALRPPATPSDSITQALEMAKQKEASASGQQNQAGADSEPKSAEATSDSARKKPPGELTNAANRLGQTVSAALRPASQSDHRRPDVVAAGMAAHRMGEGPITGSSALGAEIDVPLGDVSGSGELFERPVPQRASGDATATLRREALPMIRKLQRMLYPSDDYQPRYERFRTKGTLDPNRLASTPYSDVVFRRSRHQQMASRTGRAVVSITCDYSSSNSEANIKALRLLGCSLLEGTRRSRVRVQFSIYHSLSMNEVNPTTRGFCGGRRNEARLLQWVAGPNVPWGPAGALKALAGLESKGSGAQADALSLHRVLEEMEREVKGGRGYLVIVTDAAWNRSFKLPELPTGTDEVRALFKRAKKAWGDRLHITIAVVGKKAKSGVDDVVDKVLYLGKAQGPAQMAERVGTYVTDCIRERRNATQT